MKIYFAGSIRGGRDDRELYAQIIKLLADYGQVLTEHIGAEEMTDEGETDNPLEFIFKRDVEWLTSADWIVAEVTNPSLGVGYELGIAEKLGKKVLCLFRPSSGRKLSAMVGGNDYFTVVDYENIDELQDVFTKYLS